MTHQFSTMPRVSIIINNYKYAHFLGRCIQSTLDQAEPADEIIVVDDGSTDKSLEIAEAFGRAITIVAKKNGGQASAYNSGLAASAGDLISFLDADDLLYANAVSVWKASLAPGISKLHCILDTIDATGWPLKRKIPFIIHSGAILPSYLRFGDYAGPPSSGNVYSRTFLENIFPLPEADWRYGSDSLPYHAAPLYGAIKTVPTFGAYRIHKSSSSGGLNGNRVAACQMLKQDALQRVSFLAPHFEKRKLVGCEQPRSPSFLRILAIANTGDQSLLQSDFLLQCWESCLTYPGYPAFVRIVIFLRLLGLYLRNRWTVPSSPK
jgi:glycosyltransferase involved in cell wall biosynthesis